MRTPPLQPVTEDLTAEREVGGYRLSKHAPRRREGGSLLFDATGLGREPGSLQIASEPVQSRRARARFRRLARARAELDHPNLLAVREFGEEGGRPYVASAPVPTSSLADRLRNGPMDAGPAIRLLTAAAGALDAAHARHLVHLTFGPESILLDGESVRLDLFGLFSVTGQASWGDVVRRDPHLRYESPEAVRGEELDARSNVYSLTAILLHALTGKEPFPQADPMLIEYAHISQSPPKPSERDPRLPSHFDDLVARGMAKEASERPKSAGALLAEAATVLNVAPKPAAEPRVPAPPAIEPAAPRTEIAPVPAPERPAPGKRMEQPANRRAEASERPSPSTAGGAPGAEATPGRPGPAGSPAAAAPSRSRAVLDAWLIGTGEAPTTPVTTPPVSPPSNPAREEPRRYRPPLRIRLKPLLPLAAALAVGAAFGLLIGTPESEPAVSPTRAPADLRAVQRLDLVRERLRSDLALALTPAAQANAAERLATAHGVAAARIESPALEAATQDVSDAYAAMAVAAKAGSAKDFAAAAEEVTAAETDLTNARVGPSAR